MFNISKRFLTITAIILIVGVLTACSKPVNIWDAIQSNDISKVKKAIAGGGVKFVIPRDDGTTPLMLATNMGNAKIIELLIKAKANVGDQDKQGVTAAYIAAAKGNNTIIRILIEAKADLNARSKTGVSPLLIALLNGHTETAKLLINSEVDLNILDEIGQSPLYVAVSKGFIDISKLLIKLKADVNTKSRRGISPLFLAVITNRMELIDLLLKAKANPDVSADWLGKRQTVVEYARNTGREKILKKLMVYSKGPARIHSYSFSKPLTLKASIAGGKRLYATHCAACHQANGKGIPPTFPALKNSPTLINGSPIKAIKSILNGRRIMPSFKRLSDRDLAQIVTYIRNSWGHSTRLVTPAEIKAQR